MFLLSIPLTIISNSTISTLPNAYLSHYYYSDVIPRDFAPPFVQNWHPRPGILSAMQLLRLVQYATIHSEDHLTKGATFNVYTNIRRTRKWLRFLRTIEFLKQIQADFGKLTKCKQFSFALLRICSIL